MTIKLRPAIMDDAEFLLELKNDPVMRQFAVVTQNEIELGAHLDWLDSHLHEIQIIEVMRYWNWRRVGMIRMSEDREVSINVHWKFRGIGIAYAVLSTYCPNNVWAKIVEGNQASYRLFTGCGFVPTSQEEKGGIKYTVLKRVS